MSAQPAPMTPTSQPNISIPWMGKNVMLPRDGTRKAALKHVCEVVLNEDVGEETYLALLNEVSNDEDRLTIYHLTEMETADVEKLQYTPTGMKSKRNIARPTRSEIYMFQWYYFQSTKQPDWTEDKIFSMTPEDFDLFRNLYVQRQYNPPMTTSMQTTQDDPVKTFKKGIR